ncbi:MAG: DUF4034 domain-containing protein [Cyanobacteria bacterium SZAS TMP-1]|nr:DUF4034 domain-containing protein [Cyanobacteria bacterium SZAS TMP-1]
MKTVIVGGSKIVVAIVAVCSLVIVLSVAGIALWLKFGIRPYDRLNAQTLATEKTDPDAALAMYPKVFAAADAEHISVQDRSKLYLEYGRLLCEHGRLNEGIEALQKSAALSKSSWRGITEAAAISQIAEYRLKLLPGRKITPADIKELEVAAEIHPDRQAEGDKWFWPCYDMALGQMYTATGNYSGALTSLQKAIEEFTPLSTWGLQGAQGAYLDALVRQGKYAEANSKFIEFYRSLSADDDKSKLQSRFINALDSVRDADPVRFHHIRDLLYQKKFAELDQTILAMQHDKTLHASGIPVRGAFYSAIDSLEHSDLDAIWNERIALVQEWVKARPDSAPAKIALARLLTSYGWKARGGGWANSVSQEGWRVFADRLAQCKTALDSVKDKPPEWYTSMQRCALGQSWDVPKYNQLVDEGLKRYPDYDSIMFLKSYWLQPRWNGAEGEFERYAASVADKRGGTAGDVLYARIAWYLDSFTIHDVMQQTAMSWPRVKSGMLQIIKEYPQSLSARGMLSSLALEKDDLKTAESAFADVSK